MTEQKQAQSKITEAQERVENSDALRPYQDVIMYDWPEGEGHWEWVVRAPITEIVDWAATVFVEASHQYRAAHTQRRRGS